MFSNRRNKRFNYKSRLKDSDGKSIDDIESKWDELRNNTKRRGNILTSLPVLIAFLALLLILMYVLNSYIK